MTSMTKIIKIELLAILLIAAGLGWEFFFQTQASSQVSRVISVPMAPQLHTPTQSANAQFALAPTLAVSPTPMATQTSSQISPDGTKQLYLTSTSNPDGTKNYVLRSENSDGSNAQIVYTASESASTLSIPFNTWSPDDRYVFVNQADGGQIHALAMKADGKPITGNQTYYDLTQLFANQNSGFTYDQTTGWASNNLLIINTKASDGSQGTSYWFDVTTASLTPLATKF